jgi:hypothetical protein
MKINEILPDGFIDKDDEIKERYIDALIGRLRTLRSALRNKAGALTEGERTALDAEIVRAANVDVVITERVPEEPLVRGDV